MENKNPNHSKPEGIFNPSTEKLLPHQCGGYLHPVEGNKEEKSIDLPKWIEILKKAYEERLKNESK